MKIVKNAKAILWHSNILFCLCLAACGSIFLSPLERAERLADIYGYKRIYLKAGKFELVGFIKHTMGGDNRLTVYIEGDGFSWKNRYTLSADPTPKKSVSLQLAFHDSSPNVLYLARPCQYTGSSISGCHPRYWSTDRYSSEVVYSMNTAINKVKEKIHAKSVRLIGISGGGTIAALITLSRKDVDGLITIVANLDHKAWTTYQRITPLDGSLNPADFAVQLQSVPQVHFVGGKDKIVPEFIVRSYQEKMTVPNLTKIIIIPEYDHYCCWVEYLTRLQEISKIFNQISHSQTENEKIFYQKGEGYEN